MGKLLYLSSGAQEAVEKIKPWMSERTPIHIGDVYGQDTGRLDAYDGVLIGSHVDQRCLADHADYIAAYLEQGGRIAANGHIAYTFLPEMTHFRSISAYRVEDLKVRRHIAHPVWDGVSTEDLTWRRGVAGFYARGWHAPPTGADIIHTIGEAEHPVDFTYRVGAGQVLFHGGNDLWTFVDGKTSAARIVPQLLEWLLAKGRRP